MLVPYMYFKQSVGFCIFDFCCRFNVVKMGDLCLHNFICSSIVAEMEFICKSTFYLGYGKCLKYLNRVMLTDHVTWDESSKIFPYVIPCFIKNIQELGLKWVDVVRFMNDSYL